MKKEIFFAHVRTLTEVGTAETVQDLYTTRNSTTSLIGKTTKKLTDSIVFKQKITIFNTSIPKINQNLSTTTPTRFKNIPSNHRNDNKKSTKGELKVKKNGFYLRKTEKLKYEKLNNKHKKIKNGDKIIQKTITFSNEPITTPAHINLHKPNNPQYYKPSFKIFPNIYTLKLPLFATASLFSRLENSRNLFYKHFLNKNACDFNLNKKVNRKVISLKAANHQNKMPKRLGLITKKKLITLPLTLKTTKATQKADKKKTPILTTLKILAFNITKPATITTVINKKTSSRMPKKYPFSHSKSLLFFILPSSLLSSTTSPPTPSLSPRLSFKTINLPSKKPLKRTKHFYTFNYLQPTTLDRTPNNVKRHVTFEQINESFNLNIKNTQTINLATKIARNFDITKLSNANETKRRYTKQNDQTNKSKNLTIRFTKAAYKTNCSSKPEKTHTFKYFKIKRNIKKMTDWKKLKSNEESCSLHHSKDIHKNISYHKTHLRHFKSFPFISHHFKDDQRITSNIKRSTCEYEKLLHKTNECILKYQKVSSNRKEEKHGMEAFKFGNEASIMQKNQLCRLHNCFMFFINLL